MEWSSGEEEPFHALPRSSMGVNLIPDVWKSDSGSAAVERYKLESAGSKLLSGDSLCTKRGETVDIFSRSTRLTWELRHGSSDEKERSFASFSFQWALESPMRYLSLVCSKKGEE